MRTNDIIKKYINPFNLFVGSYTPNWLLRRTEISPGAKLCYARLCQFAGHDGECFPSQAKLASEMGAGERQVRRYLSELEDQGLIEIVQPGLNQPNRYLFLWHLWMEEGGLKKEPSAGRGKRGSIPGRSDMTAPDRPDSSGLERSKKSTKKNHLRESPEKTTTENVVVKEEQIKILRKELAPVYSNIPDAVLMHLIQEKGLDHVLTVARQTAYQLKHKSGTPENPTGYFISLAIQGMNRPHGYESPKERDEREKEAKLSAVRRLKERERDRENLTPLEEIQEFLKTFKTFGERT